LIVVDTQDDTEDMDSHVVILNITAKFVKHENNIDLMELK
jgi:hypothetical protein